MIFDRLDEALSPTEICDRILGALDRLSEPAKIEAFQQLDGKTDGETRSEIIKSGGSCIHWTEAANVATNEDMRLLTDAYTHAFLLGRRLPEDVVEKLSTMDIWLHIMSELGFRSSTNPFPGYLQAFGFNGGYDENVLRQQLITLNNLMSDKTITHENIKDKSSILYNKSLWLLPQRECASLIANYYYIGKNKSKMDASLEDYPAQLNRLRARAVEHKDRMEDYVVFSDDSPVPAKSSDITPAYLVNDFVEVFFRKSAPTSPSDSGNNGDKSESSLTQEQKQAVRDLMSNQSARLKSTDANAIAAYIKQLKDTGEIV